MVIPSLSLRPRASAHGAGLGAGLALALLVSAFVVVLARAARIEPEGDSPTLTIVALLIMTTAGVVLIARQPTGTGALALSLVAWVAGARLTLRTGAVLVGLATAANAAALAARSSHASTTVSSSMLLAALLFLTARLYRRAQADRERAELAAAELEDARERQLRSAALAERSRIARELHDVLAHSLSGLSLQLEAARLQAQQEAAGPELVEALARCRGLAADGLQDARRAVRALHGETMPGVPELADLVAGFRHAGLQVVLTMHGRQRTLAPEAGLAIYRAVQEALTNVARHSGAGRAQVDLRLDAATVRLVVSDDGAVGAPADREVTTGGSGFGLSAMRERAALLGGRVDAGPTDHGFRVELELPA